MESVVYNSINEKIYYRTLSNGLTVQFCHKPNLNKVHAAVSVKFGSLNNNFIVDDQEYEIVDGIAHFLEHKMFEKADGDVFNQYSKFGGSANAFTSFNQTVYYFVASNNFNENFEVLLKMMTTPYYTDKTVEKEKGIIAEELKMYDDNVNWVLFNSTLKNLYESHPLKIDIGGTVESIYKITADDLYLCYNTFYHPSNLLITVMGNFDMEAANSLIDKYYGNIAKTSEVINIYTEDTEVYQKSSTVNLDINVSKVCLGYKQPEVLFYDYKREFAINLFLELLFDKGGLYYEDFINNKLFIDFSYDELDTTGFSMISCETADSEQFIQMVKDALTSEVDASLFEVYKKKNLGSTIRAFNTIDSFSRIIIDGFINEYSIDDVLNSVNTLTINEMYEYARELFTDENMTQVEVSNTAA